jgi:hypothetical protein
MKVIKIKFIVSPEDSESFIPQYVNPDHIQRINAIIGDDGHAYAEYFIGDAIMYSRYEDFLTAREENIFVQPY